MVKVNEKYEIDLYPSDWNTIVTKYNHDREHGRDTVLERQIAGQPVRCMVTGYSWKDAKKPNAPLKQKILVQVTEIILENS
ncbi:MAG TPA: hypothetical protein VN372_06770 [Methanospirillum sp.]|nr:hypothetical protein [Methanospirillum sp.]